MVRYCGCIQQSWLGISNQKWNNVDSKGRSLHGKMCIPNGGGIIRISLLQKERFLHGRTSTGAASSRLLPIVFIAFAAICLLYNYFFRQSLTAFHVLTKQKSDYKEARTTSNNSESTKLLKNSQSQQKNQKQQLRLLRVISLLWLKQNTTKSCIRKKNVKSYVLIVQRAIYSNNWFPFWLHCFPMRRLWIFTKQ